MEERDLIPTKANVTEEQVINVLRKRYNLETVQLEPLDSFDDRNFFFKASNNGPDILPDGYVLKILNSKDSAKPDLIDGMFEMIKHLNKVIPTPTPILNIEGKDKFLLKFPSCPTNGNSESREMSYMIMVLKYIPGITITEVSWGKHTCFHSGILLAKITEALANFTHPGIEANETLWSLTGITKLQPYMTAVTDRKKHQIFQNIIQDFEKRVMNQLHELTPGLIHGDLNEQNILVMKNGDGEYEWSGLLDFGDIHKSYKVFDLAIMLAYLMLDCKAIPSIDAGGHILAGYLSQMQLSETEFNVLLPCIKGRLTQSLVMGTYTHQCHPENDYVLFSAENGWKLLQTLENTTEEDLIKRWKEIISQYDIRMPSYL